MPTSIVGDRVRLLRVAAGLNQTQLATELHLPINNAAISRLELGRGDLSGVDLGRLAGALGCEPGMLSRPVIDVVATKPWLRAFSDAPVKVVDRVIAGNLLAHEFIEHVALKRIADTIPRFDGDLSDDVAIEEFAQVVRSCADVAESGVVKNMVRAAERLGCVVLPLPGELGRHMGMSQYVDDVPYLRVARAPIAGDRQRFTVAHELGHLSLHAETAPPATADESRRVERQAHRFAAAFLAPAEPIIEDLAELGNRVTINTLSKLKETWGVAIKALVVRFQQLEVITPDAAQSLYKQLSSRGYGKVEPITVTTERALWLERALAKRWPGDGAEVLAARAGELAPESVRDWLTWEPRGVGSRTLGGVTQMSPTSAPQTTDGSMHATVTPIRRG